MKLLYTTHAMLFLFFPGSISAQRCVNYVQLRFSDSIAYKKSSAKPYTGCFRKMKNGRIILEGKFKNGRKDSVWVAFRDDGSFKSQKLYMAGHPKVDWEDITLKDGIAYQRGGQKPFTGVVVLYYYIIKGHWNKQVKTDDLNYATTYRNGLPKGPVIGWHNNGNRFMAGYNINGKLNGTVTYWRMDGSRQYAVEMKDDTYNGKYTGWHPNGQVSDRQHWKNGKRTGACMQWHENGEKKQRFHYRKGHLFGSWKEWDEQGQILKKQHYRNDYEHGRFRTYSAQGQALLKARYRNGSKTGLWREWHPSKEKKQIKLWGKYRRSRREGPWRCRDEQGRLLSEERWENGILKEAAKGLAFTRKELFYKLELRNPLMYVKGDSIPFSGTCVILRPDSSLRETRTYRFGLNDGPYVQYYPDGHKSREGYYDKNIPYGRQVFWHKNGRKQMERYHYYRQIDGPWVEWYDNGQIKVERHFSMGKKSGYWRKWTIDAYITEEGAYNKGQKNGLWQYRDEMGRLRKCEWYDNGVLLEKQVFNK